MTMHTKRREPAKGARRRRHRKPGETVSITVRLDSPDFEPLREVADRRGVPVANVVREACRDFILRGPVYDKAP